mmetsp:Transcript_32602/g.80685  ORF Transcript_32602/g.80685 Transcript_32602/m.80685 type:complete len:222 (+) Transcript_32602:2112-2777(+)
MVRAVRPQMLPHGAVHLQGHGRVGSLVPLLVRLAGLLDIGVLPLGGVARVEGILRVRLVVGGICRQQDDGRCVGVGEVVVLQQVLQALPVGEGELAGVDLVPQRTGEVLAAAGADVVVGRHVFLEICVIRRVGRARPPDGDVPLANRHIHRHRRVLLGEADGRHGVLEDLAGVSCRHGRGAPHRHCVRQTKGEELHLGGDLHSSGKGGWAGLLLLRERDEL